MNFLFRYRLLFFVLAVASVLRLWQLGVVPPSLDWDEVALGYNAYSVLKTGRDEYGTWFPRSLRSYDDYKPPLYMYLTIPSVATFGVSPWAVRLPSALIGIAAVLGVYFLVYELFMLHNHKNIQQAHVISVLAAGLLAISPWHIQFSRIAFEANVGVFLNIWGIAFLLKGLRRPAYFFISAFIFGLAFYAYHSERIFVPLLLMAFLYCYWKTVWQHRKQVFISLCIGVVTIAPLLPVFFDQTTLMRLRGTSSLADQTGLLARSVGKLEDDRARGDIIGAILENRRLVWAKTIFEGYISHFSLRWLFLTGDNPRHHAPGMGLLYLWELPFLIFGLFLVAKHYSKISKFLFLWLFIAPIPASPTTELPHAIRTLVFLPTFQIFVAIGIYSFVSWVATKKKIILRGIYPVICIMISWNILYYLHMYFVHQNQEFSKYWQYGYSQAVAYTQAHYQQYDKIVVSTSLEQPHMFFLFFLRFPPEQYLQAGGTKSGGFAEYRNAFDKFEFRKIHWESEVKDPKILYIGTPSELPGATLNTIDYLDGTKAIVMQHG